jgi:mono/diheme cytochrome c family protein
MKARGRRILRIGAFAVAFAAAVALVFFGWIVTGPGPMDFAGGKRVSLVSYQAGTPTGTPSEIAGSDRVARGKYLATAGDCAACHTAPGGQLNAGGLAFNLPFGTIYTPNITPDVETGIGSWTDADFLKAVHEGIAKDGSHLYPAFPYVELTYLSDDDVLAIKAYLFSLPPVHNVIPATSLHFPFNQRWLMGIWSLFFNPNTRFQPNVDRSPEWNRGAYLVEGLTHCGECHTPRNLMQALDNRHKFSGAVAAGWKAYDITGSSRGIADWTDDELAHYISSGHAAGHGTAAGPMGEAVERSFQYLTQSDVRAIVAYLRSVPGASSATPVAHSAAVAAINTTPEVGSLGGQIYAGACASCHGWSGTGTLTPYATLTGARSVSDPGAINVVQIVVSGARRETPGGLIFMPAFGNAYSDSEIAAVANFVTARFGATTSGMTATEVANLRLQTAR